MLIGDFDLDRRLLVMAEIGNNHEGSAELARELVERAAESGVGAVKLQIFEPERFVRPEQRERFEQLSRFQLSHDELVGLCELAHSHGLLVVATPLDTASLAFAAPLVDALKIASGDNDCYPLIEAVADSGLPMVISSGLADVPELEAAIAAAERRWAERGTEQEIAVLHCVSAYPVSADGADLGRIPLLAGALGRTTGYSDHTLGIEACVTAASLGARIIEKHFTLDHDFSEFGDHVLSAEPDEMAQLVREAEAAAVDPPPAAPPPQEEARRAEEEPNRAALRRSIVAASDLPRGHAISSQDLTWMRPRDGLAPGEEDRLLGKTLLHDVKLGGTIRPEDVEES